MLTRQYVRDLNATGPPAAVLAAVEPPPTSYRNHRKIVVIDGDGYAGGLNLTEKHLTARRVRGLARTRAPRGERDILQSVLRPSAQCTGEPRDPGSIRSRFRKVACRCSGQFGPDSQFAPSASCTSR